MAHGGSNFGFWSGANGGGDAYQPHTTTYVRLGVLNACTRLHVCTSARLFRVAERTFARQGRAGQRGAGHVLAYCLPGSLLLSSAPCQSTMFTRKHTTRSYDYDAPISEDGDHGYGTDGIDKFVAIR